MLTCKDSHLSSYYSTSFLKYTLHKMSLNDVGLENVSLRHHRLLRKNSEPGMSFVFVELFSSCVP